MDMLLSPILKNFGTNFSKSVYSHTDQKLWLCKVPVPHRAAWLELSRAPPPGRAGLLKLTGNSVLPTSLIPTAAGPTNPRAWEKSLTHV